MTPRQRRHNQIAGLILLGLVIAVFAWTVLRRLVLLSGFSLT